MAGGLLSALGLPRAVPEARAAQGGLCVMAFVAQVRQGPSAGQPLRAGGRGGEVRGDLSFTLAGDGNLDNATLTLDDGSQLAVVGQATGHSLQVRIEVEPRVALVAVGVGEQEIARCQGAVDGVMSGPEVGDLGDWHAAGVQQARGSGGGQAGSGNAARGSSAGTGRGNAGSQTPPQAQGTGQNASSASSGTNAGSGPDSESCPAGETYCDLEDGYWADLMTNILNCGECGYVCPATTPYCIGGNCFDAQDVPGQDGQDGCAVGLIRCGEACIDLLTDGDNCGTCGNVCPFYPLIYSCEGGGCVEPSCAPLVACGLLCVDPLTDPLNCGGCGVVCEDGTTCQTGECIVAGGGGCIAGSGLTYCGAGCVNLQTDSFNCGACSVVCIDGTTCQFGTCVGAIPLAPVGCNAGLTPCGDVCVDTASDPFNCGGCGITCPPEAPTCSGGVCAAVGAIP